MEGNIQAKLLLRNNAIPNGWETMALGQIFDFKNGINASKESYGKGVKFINVMEVIYNESITAERIPGSVEISSDQLANYLVSDGDVLFNRTSETTEEIGLTSVYLGTEPVVFGGFVIRGTPKNDKLAKLFCRYCFRGKFVRDQIIRSGQGAVRSNIGQGDLSKVRVAIPPLPEQRAIAHVLGLMDKAITANDKLIAQKELRKKWLMQNLLTGKKRLKGFVEEWKERRLGDLFHEVRSINDGHENHSIMTISAKKGLISQEDKFDRVIAGDSLKKYTQLKNRDFAYNKGNSKTYPMGCIYQLEGFASALVPFVYICFRPTKEVDPKFYKHWFLASGLDRQLNRIITSGARGDGLLNVNKKDFFNLKVPFPQIEEQSSISLIFEAIDKEIKLLKTKSDKLRQQKKGMMQVLLTGKKRLRIEN